MRPLEKTIRQYCERKIGRQPDLDNPRGYNDKIQWLKLHDQMPEQAFCCNKLAARDYVMTMWGPGLLLALHDVDETFAGLRRIAPSVVKCNHDSGSVCVVKVPADWQRAEPKITRGLGRKFGVKSGEWGYWHIKPLCFAEEYFPGGGVDYKFHCCNGRVKWVQIISERHTGHPVEHIVATDGNLLGRHLDHEFMQGTAQPHIPDTWDRMLEAASILSEPFRYVRVDLYTHEKDIRFGELTFWPKAGCYKTKDELWFGHMLDFDMDHKREPIVG